MPADPVPAAPVLEAPVLEAPVPDDGLPAGRRTLRVLALAESDAYLKWVAFLLQRAPQHWRSSIVLVSYPTSPTRRQVAEALAGSTWRADEVRRAGVLDLRRIVNREQPDVVILACTGPLVAMLDVAVLGRSQHRPVVVAGLPGIGVPVHRRAVEARRGADVFVAHGRAERDEYRAAFGSIGASTTVALARLPFLPDAARPPGERGDSVVFAPQAKVPESPLRRSILLQRIIARSPSVPIVKLRSGGGEQTTHHEPFPYPAIAEELVADGVLEPGAVRFEHGPMVAALGSARCLVTVSSTAALEAMAGGVPVALASDFGVSAALLNEAFVGSGCLVDLATGFRGDGTLPGEDWSDRHYLHHPDADDWIGQVESRVDGHRGKPRPELAVVPGLVPGVARSLIRSIAATAMSDATSGKCDVRRAS